MVLLEAGLACIITLGALGLSACIVLVALWLAGLRRDG